MSKLDELRALVNQLKALLDDPHPGLPSWAAAYGDTMQLITDFWHGGTNDQD